MIEMINFELPADIEAVRARFMSKVTKDAVSGCWLWAGAVDYRGYGRFRWNSPRCVLRAHRASFALFTQLPKQDDVICHRCDNPRCVNPGHLFIGSFSDNTIDMHRKGRQGDTVNRGESNGNSKLTADQVREIRRDPRPLSQIAAAYGMYKATISQIKNRKIWRHVA